MTYKLEIPEGTKHIKIKTIPNDFDTPISLFFGAEINPNYANSILKAFKGGINTIKVKVDQLDLKLDYYLSLQTENENAKCFLSFIALSDNIILEGEEVTNPLSNQTPHRYYIWKPVLQEDFQKQLFIYAIGGNINDFSLKVNFHKESTSSYKSIQAKEQFRGGYGVKIDLTIEEGLVLGEFYLEIYIEASEKALGYLTAVKLGVKVITEDYPNLYLMDEVIGYLDDNQMRNCFPLLLFTDKHSEGFERKISVTITSHPQSLFLSTFPQDKTDSIHSVSLSEIDSTVLFFTKGQSDPRYICIERNQSEKFKQSTYQMQLFDFSAIEDNQAFIAPIANGIQMKYVLPPGKALTVRRRRFASREISTDINLHLIKGDSVLFAYKCASYPSCKLTRAGIPLLKQEGKLTQGISLNEDYHLSIPFSGKDNEHETFDSHNKLLGGVVCLESKTSGCIFYLTMYFSGEEIELVQLEKFKNVAIESDTKSPYVFRLNNEYIKLIKFTLYCYTGDATLSVNYSNNNTQLQINEQFIGNKKIVTVQESELQPSISGKYLITVLSLDSSYYSLMVDWNSDLDPTDIVVEGGEVQMMTISKKEGAKTYKYTNRAAGLQIPYVITLQSLNCELKVFFNNQETAIASETQFIIEPTPEDDPLHYLAKISVSRPFVTVAGDDYICMFYTSGIEIDNNKDLVLNENVNHQLDLSKETINEITYSYPFSYDHKMKQIIIDISFYKKNYPLKVTVAFKGLTTSPSEVIELNRGRKLIYQTIGLEKYCSMNQICLLSITIGAKDIKDNSITYEINVKSSKALPIYFRKEKYLKSIVDLKGIQYFYTDIDRHEEGEIMVTFNKGSGIVYGRIVTKGLIEKGGWNNHVILPDKSLTETLSLRFDYFNRRIAFTSADTEKCVKGCELFIGVESDVYPDEESELVNVSEFSVLARGVGLSSKTQLNINDYAFGSINGKDDRNVYLINIPFDTKQIRVHLVSDFANANIIKGTTVPTDDYCDWKLSDPNGIQAINAGDKGLPQTLKGQWLVLIVSIVDQISSASKYALKVSASDPNMPPVTFLTSEQNEICLIDSDQKFCNMIRSVNSFEGLKDFYMAVETINNSHNSFIIFAKIIKAKQFEENFTFDDLPKRSSFDFSSEANPNKSVLHFDNKTTDKMQGNYYIVISVYGEQKGKALFFSSSIRKLNKTSLNQNSKTLFYMQKKEFFTFHLNGGTKYLASFALMQGNGLLYTAKDRITFEDSVIIEVNDLAEKEISVLALTDELVFNVNYFSIDKTKRNQLKELAFAKDNFIFSDSKIDYADAYYFKVLRDSRDRDQIIINFKFSSYEIEESIRGTEDFDINAYITDYLFILEAKKEPSKRPEPSKAIKAKYNPLIRAGIIDFNINSVNEAEERYVYIEFNQSSTNKHSYSKLSPEISAYPTGVIGSIFSFPNNNYYYDTIDKTNKMNILKFTKNDLKAKKMVIEYANCVDESLMDFSIRNYSEITALTDPRIKVNDTAIEMHSTRQFGKVIIEVNVEKYTEIAFIVFSKKTTTAINIPLSYVIKYRVVAEIIPDTVSFPDLKLLSAFDSERKILRVSWVSPQIAKTEKEEEPKKRIDYVYSVIDKGLSAPAQHSPSICLFMLDSNNNINKGYSKRVSFEEDAPGMHFEVALDFKNGTFAEVSVVALLLDEIDEEKMYSYNLSSFQIPGPSNPDTPSPEEKPKENSNYIYYIIGGVATVIAICVLSFFIYRWRQNKRNEEEQEAILSGPSMPIL